MAQQLSIKLDDSLFQLEEEKSQVRMLTTSIEVLKSQSQEMQVSSEALKKAADDQSKDTAYTSLVCVVECAERDTKASLSHLVSDEMSGTTCPPEHLVRCSEKTKLLLEELVASCEEYSADTKKLGKVLSSLPSASNSFCDLLSNAKATQQLISEEDSEKLVSSCQDISDKLLAVLNAVKKKDIKEGDIADKGASLKSAMEAFVKQNSSLVPEEEGDMTLAVGEEMSATVKAVDDAIARIQALLQKSRETDKGHKLEVNSSILGACTTLMEAMQTLIKAAIALQDEIVAEGRGASSSEEFYKKHHRWTEGLVSAAKSVGNGATMVVNSADKVVNGQGKFEELIVYSKDIAASTAQLVAASRVKARARSERLTALKGASRKVTEATGGVVATAQSHLNRKQSESFEYLKNLSLTQAKRAEMECQVRALELEKELESERSRLAELRKLHYHLAGSEEGWEVDEEQS
jgi:huntingtin interacting protein 1